MLSEKRAVAEHADAELLAHRAVRTVGCHHVLGRARSAPRRSRGRGPATVTLVVVLLQRDDLGRVPHPRPGAAARSRSTGSSPIWVTKIRGDGLSSSTPSLMLRKNHSAPARRASRRPRSPRSGRTPAPPPPRSRPPCPPRGTARPCAASRTPREDGSLCRDGAPPPGGHAVVTEEQRRRQPDQAAADDQDRNLFVLHLGLLDSNAERSVRPPLRRRRLVPRGSRSSARLGRRAAAKACRMAVQIVVRGVNAPRA